MSHRPVKHIIIKIKIMLHFHSTLCCQVHAILFCQIQTCSLSPVEFFCTKVYKNNICTKLSSTKLREKLKKDPKTVKYLTMINVYLSIGTGLFRVDQLK
jgi:hypothetical protein